MSDEEAIALGIEELKGSYKEYEQEDEYISLYKAMGHFNIYNKALTGFLVERCIINSNCPARISNAQNGLVVE